MMKQAEAKRLNNNWTFVNKVWKEKQIKYGLTKWSLRCSDMSDKVGVCDYNRKTITLSTVFMRGSNCNYAKVKKALMHEIAHALTPGHSHDKIWKTLCEGIGGDTRLAATMNLPGMNWSIYCPGCKWRQEQFTKPNLENAVCGTCYSKIIIKYIK